MIVAGKLVSIVVNDHDITEMLKGYAIDTGALSEMEIMGAGYIDDRSWSCLLDIIVNEDNGAQVE